MISDSLDEMPIGKREQQITSALPIDLKQVRDLARGSRSFQDLEAEE